MKYTTFLHLLARDIFTVAIFFFIKKQTDYLYVPLINSFGSITAGLLSLWIVWKNFKTKFRVPSLTTVVEQLKDGLHIFISTITASIYTTAIPFILGVLTNYEIVGYYSTGEKIIRALEGMLGPLSRAVYPYISNIASKSRVRAIIFVRKLSKIIGSATFLLSLAIIFFAPQISNIILGNQFSQSIPVIRILAFLLFAKGLGHIFLLQTMLNFGHDRAVFRVVLLASLVSITSSFVLIPFFFASARRPILTLLCKTKPIYKERKLAQVFMNKRLTNTFSIDFGRSYGPVGASQSSPKLSVRYQFLEDFWC